VGLSTNGTNGVLAIGLCVVMVAGCSGGGASIGMSPIRPQSRSSIFAAQSALTAQSTKGANGNVTFTIGIKPKTKTGRITPKYVSLSTQSLKILTDGANPVVVNLTPSSPNCSPNRAAPGAYICTASLNVPAGNHVFTVTTYDLTDAEGNVLSTNTTGAVDVKPTGTTTTVSLVLEGVVRYVVLTLATTNPPVGKAAAIGLTPILEDADGNLIVGPAPYAYAVTLTTTDSSNGSLSKTTLNSPADLAGITVNYTGVNVASFTYSATATGLPVGNVIDAVLTPGATPTKPQYLYVTNQPPSDWDGLTVSVFDTAHENAPLPTITGLGDYAWGVAVDATGKLYVANYYSNSVSVFDTAHGNAVLPVITGGGLDGPDGVAVDASGKLYVANGTSANSMSVFDTAHGNAVLPAITGGGLYYPSAVALDASGKLYVSNSDNSVSGFDTAHGNAVLPPITGGGLDAIEGVAIGASGRLYVSNFYGDSVSVFDTAHGNAALPPITTGLDESRGLALDRSGKLYVINRNSVLVFDTAHGNAVMPAITGGGLHYPLGIAVDASGKL
jgi:YVTN family beta-propeller protein